MRVFSHVDFSGFQVLLFLSRLRDDWDSKPPAMRTQWTFKEALNLHAITGGFLCLKHELQAKVPKADFDAAVKDLDAQFQTGLLDPQIEHLLFQNVPPPNLHEVAFLRILAGSSISNLILTVKGWKIVCQQASRCISRHKINLVGPGPLNLILIFCGF